MCMKTLPTLTRFLPQIPTLSKTRNRLRLLHTGNEGAFLFSFSVLHEETLEPVYRMEIPVCIKNTNNPSAPGTTIVPKRKLDNGPVIGIASGTGFCCIYIKQVHDEQGNWFWKKGA